MFEISNASDDIKFSEAAQMDPISILISLLIGLAANGATIKLQEKDREKFEKALKDQESLRKPLDARRSLNDEVASACNALARNKDRLGIPSHEKKLWSLLNDEVFQINVSEWLRIGSIQAGEAVQERLERSDPIRPLHDRTLTVFNLLV